MLTPLAKAGVTYNVLLQQAIADENAELEHNGFWALAQIADDRAMLTHDGYKALARDVMKDAA